MSERGDSDERPMGVPTVKDMLREIKRKPAEAERLLGKWLATATMMGHDAGLVEGLTRAAEPVRRTTLAALGAKR